MRRLDEARRKLNGGKLQEGQHVLEELRKDGPDNPAVRPSERYPWLFDLKHSQLYRDNLTVIDADLRIRLDAFDARDSRAQCAWLVQATGSISRHDFQVLTRHGKD